LPNAQLAYREKIVMIERFKKKLLSAIGIEYPIIQAPMAGSPTSPELVAAVSNAGALGSLGAGMLSPQAMTEQVERIRVLTDRPFNVNLFILDPPRPTEAELAEAQARLVPLRAELGLTPAAPPSRFCEDNGDQIAALLELAPPVVSFTFGLLDKGRVAEFQHKGCRVIGSATTTAEARAWEETGADFVCLQGVEGGGHRGTFLGDVEQSGVGLMALLSQAARAVRVPLIAAGGIMDGRGIAAALILGAQAVQLGTAFLCCPESGAHPGWKRRLQRARDDETRLTRVFSGKFARGLVNEFMERLRPFEAQIPPYPIQNALTREIRRAAARQERTEFMSLWAGQGAGLCRSLPAGQLVTVLMEELDAALPGAILSD